MKTALWHFFLGIVIAFSLSIVAISVALSFAAAGTVVMMPVRLVWQSLALAAACSSVNLIYRSERLPFLWKSILGYVLTTSAILCSAVLFGWLGFGSEPSRRARALAVFFAVCSACYFVTWFIILRVRRAEEKALNERLREYIGRR